MSISDIENGVADPTAPPPGALVGDQDLGLLICKQVAIPNVENIITPIIAEALRSGMYEHTEAAMLDRVIEPGDRVLELGAGIGFISTIAARLNRAASYLALEPNPHLPEFIRSIHEMNAVTGIEVAHGLAAAIDYTSAVDFYIRKDFWMSSLSPEPLPIVRKATTPAIPLAMLLQERNINVIISDIEGAEVDLFSRSHLEGVERVYVEIHEHLTGFQGVKTLFDSMSAKGFVYDYRCSEGSIIMFRRP